MILEKGLKLLGLFLQPVARPGDPDLRPQRAVGWARKLTSKKDFMDASPAEYPVANQLPCTGHQWAMWPPICRRALIFLAKGQSQPVTVL